MNILSSLNMDIIYLILDFYLNKNYFKKNLNKLLINKKCYDLYINEYILYQYNNKHSIVCKNDYYYNKHIKIFKLYFSKILQFNLIKKFYNKNEDYFCFEYNNKFMFFLKLYSGGINLKISNNNDSDIDGEDRYCFKIIHDENYNFKLIKIEISYTYKIRKIYLNEKEIYNIIFF